MTTFVMYAAAIISVAIVTFYAYQKDGYQDNALFDGNCTYVCGMRTGKSAWR